MKIDFDSFEFAGLIVPGSVIVFLYVYLNPQLMATIQPTLGIAAGLLASYVLGHLIAAIGNLAEPILPHLGVYKLDDVPIESFERLGYADACQLREIEKLVQSKLHREGLGEPKSVLRKTILKQFYLLIAKNNAAKRLDMFNGLHNLSRGLSVAFILAAILSASGRQYGFVVAFLVAAMLTMYRAGKFKSIYSTELLQGFLLVDSDVIQKLPEYVEHAAIVNEEH